MKYLPSPLTLAELLPPDEAGNNLRNARDIGILETSKPTPQNFSDFVGVEDRNDYYRFELETESNFDLHLYGLTDNANVFLLDTGGNIIASSKRRNNNPESINTKLEAGTYYIAVRPSKQTNTDYQLSLTALEDSALKSPTLIEYVVPPQATDRAIDNWLDPHYVAIDESVPSNNKLFLFFSGNNSQPLNQQLIIREAAELGYHAINLSYPSSPPVGNVCQDSTDLECYERVRLEVLDGIDRTDLVNVSLSNSIENRLVELLQYLDRQHPDRGWDAYLEAGLPDWDEIVVSGHSQGGGYALMVGKEHEVARVVTFAAQIDESPVFEQLAPWLSKPFATPSERIYEFVHLQDPRFDRHPQLWDILDLTDFGEPVNVDETASPYNNSHILVTDLPPIEGGSPHGSVVTDRSTPKLPDGTPVYEEVWQYLLGDSSAALALVTDGAGNSLNTARELGILDLNPFSQTYADFVGTEDRRDFYQFELQASSSVSLSLDGLSANANLFLLDSQGNTISSSQARGTTAELIIQDLDPGTYYVSVRPARSANTNYELTLSAEFLTDDDVVSNPNTSLADPEFDGVGFQVTWQEKEGERRLFVAPIDPVTGDLLLSQRVVVDSGLAPTDTKEGGTGNGPEWVYSADGSQILYTKLIDSNWYIGRAQKIGTKWQAELLTDATGQPVGGSLAFGTLEPTDPNPLIKYVGIDPISGEQDIFWRELNNPNVGGEVPGGGGRWVQGEGERALVRHVSVSGYDNKQLFKYDVYTDTLTQATFDDDTKKQGSAFMWQAPEFNGDLVLMTPEIEVVGEVPATPEPDRIGIYRNTGGQWTKINEIESPNPDLPYFHSPEIFTYNGKSYISTLMVTTKSSGAKQFKGAEVWLLGVEPDENFARQVSEDDSSVSRNDPESLITESGAFIYYAEITADGTRIIHRADTGLDTPAPINTQETFTMLNAQNITAASSFTVTKTTDGGAGSLRQAIIDANASTANDVIELAAGTYTLSLAGFDENAAATGDLDILNNGTLRIVGLGAGATIDATGLGDRVFNVLGNANLILENITITGGTATNGINDRDDNNQGGGIRIEKDGSATLTDSTVSGNASVNRGGGIFNSKGTLTIDNSTISGNSASSGAGLATSGNMTVSNSDISGNTAVNGGGGIAVASGTTTVNNTNISNNSGGFNGGGIFLDIGGRIEVADSLIADNTADNKGGGLIAFGNSNATVTNTTVSGNFARKSGGGIQVEKNGNMTLIDSTVSDNTADVNGSASNGGGISTSGSVNITGSTISTNFANSGGGGINIDADGSLTMTDSTVSGNSAIDRGAGIFNNFGIATIADSIITTNAAGNNGGGIASNGTLNVNNTTVSGNSTETGGGGGIGTGGPATITNSTISGNSAGFNGGGIFNFNSGAAGSNATVTNTTISGNSARNSGGGIFNFDGTIALNNTTLTDNSARNSGGGLFNGNSATLTNSIIANSDGADVVNNGGATTNTTGVNLIEDGSLTGTNILNQDPSLGPLQDNGGSTQTHALLSGSPAIDAGSNAQVPPDFDSDQRGFGYPRIVGTKVDLGALEAANIVGTTGQDTLTGTSDNDLILGLDGRDRLKGTGGNDSIIGGGGADRLRGGGGSDLFVYTAVGDRSDLIKDFAAGQDKIVLRELLESIEVKVDSYNELIDGGFLKFLQQGTSVLVEIDPDGLGSKPGDGLFTVENVTIAALNNANNFVIQLWQFYSIRLIDSTVQRKNQPKILISFFIFANSC